MEDRAGTPRCYPRDLTSFLEARIEEDECIARYVRADSPTADTEFCMWATGFDRLDPDRLIVAVDYQRVLAECAAKRRIIGAFWDVWDHDSSAYETAADYMETVVRELASAYRDHDDYRDEWRDSPGAD